MEASKEVLLREWSDTRWLFLESRDDSQYWHAQYYLAMRKLNLFERDWDGHVRRRLKSVEWFIRKGGYFREKNGWFEAILGGNVIVFSARFSRIPVLLTQRREEEKVLLRFFEWLMPSNGDLLPPPEIGPLGNNIRKPEALVDQFLLDYKKAAEQRDREFSSAQDSTGDHGGS
jgi:hypothetical protein